MYVSIDMSMPDTAAMLPATKQVLGENVCSLRRVCSLWLAVSRARQQTPVDGPNQKLSSGSTRDCQGATSGTRGALSPASDAKCSLRSFFPKVPAPSCSYILVFLSLPWSHAHVLVVIALYPVLCITRCPNRPSTSRPTTYAIHKHRFTKNPA